MIKKSQLIEETVSGLNYLTQKHLSKEYSGGIIGPAASSLFLIVLIIREENIKNCETQHELSNYYKYHSKKQQELNDNIIINCLRHALAHGRFIFQLDNIKFETKDYGSMEIPYDQFPSLTNMLISIYNKLIKTR